MLVVRQALRRRHRQPQVVQVVLAARLRWGRCYRRMAVAVAQVGRLRAVVGAAQEVMPQRQEVVGPEARAARPLMALAMAVLALSVGTDCHCPGGNSVQVAQALPLLGAA